jgi:hypothetical protein
MQQTSTPCCDWEVKWWTICATSAYIRQACRIPVREREPRPYSSISGTSDTEPRSTNRIDSSSKLVFSESCSFDLLSLPWLITKGLVGYP